MTRKEQRFKDLERLDKLEHRKAALECDIAWAQVKDLEAVRLCCHSHFSACVDQCTVECHLSDHFGTGPMLDN